MRPVNNVVDVSNYVMLELGQPSHTFDLNCVKDSEFKVRWASAGEEITTLDGVVRNLTEQDGVVTDGLGSPIGIAGVMGGASTEISESTSTVALEMAWWNPSAIAKTSRRLGNREYTCTSPRCGKLVHRLVCGARQYLRFAYCNAME